MEETSLIQRAYTAILEHFVQTGRAPHYTELAKILEIRSEEARELQFKTAEAGVACWLSDGTDYIEFWGPFSNIPTQHRVTVEGKQKWFALCGLEALAVHWLFPGTEVIVESTCLDCGDPLRIRLRDEEILEADPPTIVGHMNVPLSHRSEVPEPIR